jgi:hypothetical protein
MDVFTSYMRKQQQITGESSEDFVLVEHIGAAK